MTTDAAAALDPLTLPLAGSRLIEASAGTGKTWTIAALFLRAVLGHGVIGPGRPLAPSEILVMSFTRAATRELSDRVRARLVEAAACFRGSAEPPAHDAFLRGLLAAYPAGDAREAAAWRLGAAAEAMDDAAVTTIDAWCQRMLREHAFDSGSLFDEELQPDLTAARAEAARDVWRQQVYPLDDAALALVLAVWRDPEDLVGDVARRLDDAPPADGRTLQAVADEALARQAAALAALKHGWVERAEALRGWLQAHAAAFDGRRLRIANADRWLDALVAWAGDPALASPSLTDAAWDRLTPDGLAAAFKAGAAVELPAVVDDFAALPAQLAALPDPREPLRAHAAALVAERLRAAQSRDGAWGFADLLRRLHDALDEARHGDRARRLRARIVAQFPLALVDEFQDTSPVQLGIFDRLYRIADDEPSRALLLIGDPKQAIYAFRGADIRSYLQARRATAGRHHALGTNHRSTQALVEAVNRWLLAAEQRPGAGAFGLRAPGGEHELPFVPVAARGRAATLVSADGALPAITLVHDAALQSQKDNRPRHAALCAERIVGLLNDTQAGFETDGRLARLRPADIAVLVRSGTEAAAVRAALRRRGVASVYLSDQDSVFASREAGDLLRILRAWAAPQDTRLARAALATGLVGLPLAELLAMAADERRLDAQCERLRALAPLWPQQGVLAAVRALLQAFELPARWLAEPGGERRLTDALHLAELLQAASAQLDGEQALIRWLAQQLEAARAGRAAAEEQVLRLESDADLVQVVTVHKSKGLEYPLVFLPFATGVRLADKGEDDDERLREDLRLLYVALTRARHALWIGCAALTTGPGKACTWSRSAFGRLIGGEAAVEPEALPALLAPLAHAQCVVLPAPAEAAVTRLAPRDAPPPLRPSPVYAGTIERGWGIASYTALVRDMLDVRDGRDLRELATPAVIVPRRDDEPADEPGNEPAEDAVPAAAWHGLPRGAAAGSVLHGLLEWLAGEGFAVQAPAVREELRRRLVRAGWEREAEAAAGWLERVCRTPLPPLGVALDGLRTQRAEMEFWLPADGLHAGELGALCHQHVLPGRARPPLPERTLQGLLMGFADLVFAHDGRHGVLDHKSNHLGAGDADYTPAALEAALLAHRYDVQAVLYLFALHRLLKARLGAAYVPARQLGPAVFLFLRGIAGPAAGCVAVAPPLALLEALDARLPAPEMPR